MVVKKLFKSNRSSSGFVESREGIQVRKMWDVPRRETEEIRRLDGNIIKVRVMKKHFGSLTKGQNMRGTSRIECGEKLEMLIDLLDAFAQIAL
ncbi:hypothetical protein AVEN_61399-1 [Araneus ventricosus]|uniref:Uncharacterized protein n=1 Tax=Araneus ventricosus TaxID=182803 RepID=A0A4Y2QD92_ARAVE|nr:hypothetical protein AVEN_61399-1 [Araneus ventricosus]